MSEFDAALDAAAVVIWPGDSDKESAERAKGRKRLELLLYQVQAGRITDFYAVTGRDSKGRPIYHTEPIGEEPVMNDKDQQVGVIYQYETTPQWSVPVFREDGSLYIHSRAKRGLA